jgi:hypothetical protein
MGSGFDPFACATARTAFGLPRLCASSEYERVSPNGMSLSARQTSRWNTVPTGAIGMSNSRRAPRKYSASCVFAFSSALAFRPCAGESARAPDPLWKCTSLSCTPSLTKSRRPIGVSISSQNRQLALICESTVRLGARWSERIADARRDKSVRVHRVDSRFACGRSLQRICPADPGRYFIRTGVQLMIRPRCLRDWPFSAAICTRRGLSLAARGSSGQIGNRMVSFALPVCTRLLDPHARS